MWMEVLRRNFRIEEFYCNEIYAVFQINCRKYRFHRSVTEHLTLVASAAQDLEIYNLTDHLVQPCSFANDHFLKFLEFWWISETYYLSSINL